MTTQSDRSLGVFLDDRLHTKAPFNSLDSFDHPAHTCQSRLECKTNQQFEMTQTSYCLVLHVCTCGYPCLWRHMPETATVISDLSKAVNKSCQALSQVSFWPCLIATQPCMLHKAAVIKLRQANVGIHVACNGLTVSDCDLPLMTDRSTQASQKQQYDTARSDHDQTTVRKLANRLIP